MNLKKYLNRKSFPTSTIAGQRERGSGTDA